MIPACGEQPVAEQVRSSVGVSVFERGSCARSAVSISFTSTGDQQQINRLQYSSKRQQFQTVFPGTRG